MAEHSFPWASVDGDRVYSADDFAQYFLPFTTNGVFPISDELEVTAGDGMTVSVSAGYAWINATGYRNDAVKTLTIDAADGILNRIDRIVIRRGRAERAIWLAVLKGTPASSPAAPAVVRDADYFDLGIATVSVNAGITEILDAYITDTREDTDVCGMVISMFTTSTTPEDIGAIPATEKGAANGLATLDTDTKLTPEQGTSSIVSVTTARALALTDKSKFLTANSASAITVTIPANATVAFPVGSEIELCQYGAGTLTIIGASGVTVNGVSAGSVQSSERYACIAIKKIGTDEWIAAGGLG